MKMRRIISLAKNDAGLTVVELVFASVVLMGAIITMMSMFDTAIDILRYTTARSLATQVGNEVMEDFRSISYDGALIEEVGTWPDDPDLDDGFDPPKYRDIDDSSSTVWRSLVTTDTDVGLTVERSVERHRINFLVRKYVLWADDGASSQAYKRLIVRVSWVDPYIPGEVVLTTNLSEETEVESRPAANILGVRSTNYNYFSVPAAPGTGNRDTTMGAGDSIRGPGAGVITPVVWTAAVITGAKAKYIKEVGYKIYAPDGTVARETTVTSVTAIDGRYFKWVLKTTGADELLDGTGYLIRAEAVDDRDQSDVDSMPINIDNTAPRAAYAVTTSDATNSPYTLRVDWSWDPDPGDNTPEISRFLIKRWRKETAGGGWIGPTPFIHPRETTGSKNWYSYALPGTERTLLDQGLFSGERYAYEITTIDTAGNVAVTTQKTRDIPIGVSSDTVGPNGVPSASADAVSWKTAEVTWSQATDAPGPSSTGVGGYNWIVGDGTGWAWFGVSTDTVNDPATIQDPGLYPGKTYDYWSRAFDVAGNRSGWESAGSITTPMR